MQRMALDHLGGKHQLTEFFGLRGRGDAASPLDGRSCRDIVNSGTNAADARGNDWCLPVFAS